MSLLWPAASAFLLVSALTALPLAAAPPRGYAARPADPSVVQHKVTRGETLWSISQKHRTSVGAIMDYNHLPDHNVREGMLLRIPPNVVESVPQARHHIHVVKRGEDFWSIADRYDIDSSVLAKANPNVNPNRIHQDMELIIPVVEQGDKSTKRPAPGPGPGPVPPPPRPQTGMVQHTVGDNETFYSIGRKYGVPMEAVVAANPTVRPERLRGGMKVWVPSKNTPPPPPPPVPASSKSKVTDTTARNRARTHTVKENESIASIAKKYGVSESALLRENKLEEDDAIYIDDVLKIPGSSSGSGSGSTVASPPKLASVPPPRTTPTPAPVPSQTRMPVNSPPNTVGSDGAIRSYIVSAGENENTICDAFGISKQTLFEYNHLPANTKLKPGDEIAIPRVSRGKRR